MRDRNLKFSILLILSGVIIFAAWYFFNIKSYEKRLADRSEYKATYIKPIFKQDRVNNPVVNQKSFEERIVSEYVYNKKRLALVETEPDRIYSRDLYLINESQTKKISSLPPDAPGGGLPEFGTTTLSKIGYAYIASFDMGGGFWDHAFVNMEEEDWLEAIYYRFDQFWILKSKFIETQIQFNLIGSCLEDGKIQSGKKLVKILGLTAKFNSQAKEYVFLKPVQLTCNDYGEIGFYKEPFQMTIYALDPELKKLAFLVKGKRSDGSVWQDIVGYDLNKQDFVSWEIDNKGFNFDPKLKELNF